MKHDHISTDGSDLVISATEFKATCLDIFSRLAARRLKRVIVTRRGKPVAELFPPSTGQQAGEQLFDFMRGSVSVAAGVDLTAPVIDMAQWSTALPE